MASKKLASKKLSVFAAIAVALLTFCANFGVFLYSYRRLVFEYLSEWQRMENVNYIFTAVLGGFATASVVVGVAVFWAMRRCESL